MQPAPSWGNREPFLAQPVGKGSAGILTARAAVAQWIERLPPEQKAEGSSPFGRANQPCGPRMLVPRRGLRNRPKLLIMPDPTWAQVESGSRAGGLTACHERSDNHYYDALRFRPWTVSRMKLPHCPEVIMDTETSFMEKSR